MLSFTATEGMYESPLEKFRAFIRQSFAAGQQYTLDRKPVFRNASMSRGINYFLKPTRVRSPSTTRLENISKYHLFNLYKVVFLLKLHGTRAQIRGTGLGHFSLFEVFLYVKLRP